MGPATASTSAGNHVLRPCSVGTSATDLAIFQINVLLVGNRAKPDAPILFAPGTVVFRWVIDNSSSE